MKTAFENRGQLLNSEKVKKKKNKITAPLQVSVVNFSQKKEKKKGNFFKHIFKGWKWK